MSIAFSQQLEQSRELRIWDENEVKHGDKNRRGRSRKRNNNGRGWEKEREIGKQGKEVLF